MKTHLVSIIISTHNKKDELLLTLLDLYEKTFGNFEIIVVSASSNDGTDDIVTLKYPNVRLLIAPDIGWGEANNLGTTVANGDIFFFCGADMRFEYGWLIDTLSKMCELHDCGAFGTLVVRVSGDGSRKLTGVSELSLGKIIHYPWNYDLSYLNNLRASRGVVAVVDNVYYPFIFRDVFKEVGGFDPTYFYLGDDTDLGCKIVSMGYKNYIYLKPNMYTEETKKSDKALIFWYRNRIKLIIKWNPLILVPIFLSYPIIKTIFASFFLFLSGRRIVAKSLLSTLKWNFQNFNFTRRSRQLNFIEDNKPN